jgi:iron(III) transport system ATP-binding protein
MTAGLVVTGLYAAHGAQPVLHGVDLTVPERALACILGPSGCGKTTLLRTIAGFHRPARGRIELHDRVLDQPPGRHLSAERRKVGYIPQDVALFPHLTVAANIGFGLPRSRRAGKVAELLELTDLGRYAGRHPHQLSGGQQQRVGLARALAPEPELLLLDEPFSALDAGLRARVRADVTDLLRATGTTAVLVTHDAGEALAFADLITVLRDGRVLQTGTPEHLHDSPVSGAVARALGDANILDAVIDGDYAKTVLGSLRLRGLAPDADLPGSVLVRPEQVVVRPESGPYTTPGRVTRSTFLGRDHRLELEIGGSERPVVAYTPDPVEPGATVYVAVDGTVHGLDA